MQWNAEEQALLVKDEEARRDHRNGRNSTIGTHWRTNSVEFSFDYFSFAERELHVNSKSKS